MDLITQHEGMKVDGFRDKIINADMEGPAFDERWSSLPIVLRAQLFIIIPVYVVYLISFWHQGKRWPRETWRWKIYLLLKEILLEDESFEQLDSLLVDERDRKLMEHYCEG